MITQEQFYDNAKSHDICEPYLKRWEGCNSKASLYRMACEVQPVSYLVKAVSEGWGVSPSVICETFGKMLNGGYKVEVEVGGDGKEKYYTSSIWCSHDGDIECDTTVCCLIDCKGDVYVSKNNISMIYIDSSSDVKIHCLEGSSAFVETYSRDVVVLDKGKTKIKYLGNE